MYGNVKNRPHHTTTTNYTFPPVVLTISRSEAEVNLLVPLAGWGLWGRSLTGGYWDGWRCKNNHVFFESDVYIVVIWLIYMFKKW